MNGLQDFEKLFELADQCALEVWHEIRIGADGTFKTLQAFASYATGLKGLIIAIEISIAAQEFQVRLADYNIVWRSIVVKLLVPLLREMPAHLFDVVAVHDLQNFITDPLAITAATDGRQHKPEQGTS